MHPIQKKYLSYQEFSIRFKCMRVSWKYEKFYDFLNRENILSFKYVVATKYYVHLKAFKRENFETIQTRKTGYFSWDRQIFSLMKPKWDNLPLISFVQMHLSTSVSIFGFNWRNNLWKYWIFNLLPLRPLFGSNFWYFSVLHFENFLHFQSHFTNFIAFFVVRRTVDINLVYITGKVQGWTVLAIFEFVLDCFKIHGFLYDLKWKTIS